MKKKDKTYLIFDILMCSIALIQHLEHLQMHELHTVVIKTELYLVFSKNQKILLRHVNKS